jgi:conflict system STAND superfamily ATPase
MPVEIAQADHMAGGASPMDDAAPPSPYVGLKPYSEKERPLFFGRDPDGRRLVNKIFSARLTLFYGPSGVGKSSLLSAHVVPQLREAKIGNALVVIFDRWSEAEAETAIKCEIARAIGPDATAICTAEPLTAWAGFINREQRKPLVLILDQFEQFLLARTGRPDPLRAELAALVRADLDVHLVISLREEFLAGLEIFADEIVTIYDSKFRLGHLTDAGTEDAIVKPARKFGVAVAPDLVDALKTDLKRQDETALTATATTPGVELPFLQIVCKELWESRGPGSMDRLTLDLYTDLGRRDGIIRRYVESLADTLPPGMQDDAAEVLKWLAPRNGVKQSHDAAQLSDMTRLAADRIEQVLQHFESHWVLRQRLIGGGRWYELYHDAYIRVLRPWIEKRLTDKREREEREERANREHVERQQRRARRWKWGTAIALATSITLLITLLEVRSYEEEQSIATGNIDQAIAKLPRAQTSTERMLQRRRLDPAFVESADATLRKVKNQTDRRAVKDLLTDLERRFTESPRADYIYETPCMEAWAADVLPEPGDHPVVTLSFNPARELDRIALRCAWAERAMVLRKSAIPVILPWRIAVKPDKNLSTDIIGLSFGGTSFQVSFPVRQHAAVVVSTDLTDERQLMEFLESEHDTVQLLDVREGKLGVRHGSAEQTIGWVLPRWAFPLLRAAKIDPKPEEIAVVDAVVGSLLRDQGPALTQQVIDYLIDHTSADASTVAEAKRARGGASGIRKVLLALVAKRKRDQQGAGDQLSFVFEHFTQILDSLGRYPREMPTTTKQSATNASQTPVQNDPASAFARTENYTDEGAAAAVLSEFRSLRIVRPADLHLRGAVASATAAAPASAARDKLAAGGEGDLIADYDLSRAAVPTEARRVRVLLGSRLVPCLVEDNGLTPSLVRAMQELRHDIRRRSGVNVPSVLFVDAEERAPNEFSVEFDGARIAGISDPLAVDGDCLKDTVHAMGVRLELARAMWLSTEDVDLALRALGTGQAAWLRRYYSLTDLKLLMRAVLSPEKDEIETVRPSLSPDGRTVRDLPDLLLSLIFWSKACPGEGGTEFDGNCLVEGLRETERARFTAGGPVSSANGRVSQPLMTGIDALVGSAADPLLVADREFTAAVKEASSEAKELFPRLFASQILLLQADRLEQDCSLRPGELSGEAKAGLDDFFDAAETAQSGRAWQHLKVCRLRSFDPKAETARLSAELEKLMDQAPPSDWSADDAAAVATLTLKIGQQRGVAGAPQLQQAQSLYARAFQEWGSTDNSDKAEATFSEAIGVCEDAPGPRGCWSVLKAGLQAYGKPSVPMAVDLGWDLAAGGNPGDASYSLELIGLAERHLAEQSEDQRKPLSAWLSLIRASADINLARYGDKERLAEAKALLTDPAIVTKDKAGWPSPATRYDLQARLARLSGDRAAMDALLASARPEDELSGSRMLLLLLQGRLSEKRELLEASAKMPDDARVVARVVLQFLGEAPAAELEGTAQRLVELKHQWRDYVELLLFVATSREGHEKEARRRLHRRWEEIEHRRESWSERLAQGDMTAWQEMLIGYFVGEIPRERILALIGDPEHFTASPLAATEESRAEYLTEFYFYDAQLQSVIGDRERQLSALRQAVDSGGVETDEYVMAVYQQRALEAQP